VQAKRYFLEHLPHVGWQPTDGKDNLYGIQQGLDESGLAYLKPVWEVEITVSNWVMSSVRANFIGLLEPLGMRLEEGKAMPTNN